MSSRGDLLVELIHDYTVHAEARLALRSVSKVSRETLPQFGVLRSTYTIRLAKRVFYAWKLVHHSRYRRSYNLLLGSRRRERTDATPIIPFSI